MLKKAKESTEIYLESQAREKLEILLAGEVNIEKASNPKYNQDDFLDKLIINRIGKGEIIGDVVVIDGYAFELDRTVPRIKNFLGKKKDLAFPTINVTVEVDNDRKSATINVTSKEEKNGISKIEIWLLGEKIKEYTYENIKTEIIVDPYIVTQNGEYKVKVYGNLWSSKTVEVDDIVPAVRFEPDGSEENEWKAEYSTTVTIPETLSNAVKANYVWLNKASTPEDDEFPETQTFVSGETISKNELSGTYYLWIMLEMPNKEKVKWRSGAFNFDNEDPEIESFNATKKSESKIELSIVGNDSKSGIKRLEFYVDDILKYENECDTNDKNISNSYTIEQLSTGKHKCKAVLIDWNDNDKTMIIDGETMLYSWNEFTIKTKKIYSETYTLDADRYEFTNQDSDMIFNWGTEYEFDKYTGMFSLKIEGRSNIKNIPSYAYLEPRNSSDGKTLWQYRGGLSHNNALGYVSFPYDLRFSIDRRRGRRGNSNNSKKKSTFRQNKYISK